MPKYAYVIDGVAQDVVTPPEGFTIEDCFHPDLVSNFVEVPDNVTKGSTLKAGKWTIFVQEAPSPEPVVYSVVSPMTFLMLFKSAERIAIEDLVETDRIVKDWWTIVNNPKLTEVDLNLGSVQEALDYLVSLSVLKAERKNEILTGVVK